MKSIYTLVLVFAVTALSAQITIDANDFGQLGDQVVVARDNVHFTTLDITSTGQQTWDFSAFVITSYEFNEFSDPMSVANAAQFSNANIVYATSNLNTMLNANASGVDIVGYDGDAGLILGGAALGVELSVPFEDPMNFIQFPANYLDSYTDTNTFDRKVDAASLLPNAPVDSIRVVHNATATHTIDAYGTMILLGDTQAVLRKKKIDYFIDTIYINVAGNWIIPPNFEDYFDENPRKDTIITYEWYAKNRKYPLVTIQTDAKDSITASSFLADSMLIANAFLQSNLLCYGDSNAAAVASVIDLGTAPYTYAWSNGASGQTASNLSSGYQYVTITDVDGKMGVAATFVPEALEIVTNPAISGLGCNACTDGQISLIPSGGTAPYTYMWSGGQTSSTISSLDSGNYSVTVTDANACSVSEAFYVFPLSLKSLEEKAPLLVYPNPSRGLLHLEYESVVNIFDVSGALVLSLNPVDHVLDLSALPKGAYFIEQENKYSKVILK